MNNNFNSLIDRLEHKHIKIEDFLYEDNVIKLKNGDYTALISRS